MESKITFLLFVFLAFCLVGKNLYVQIMSMVAQNKGNHDSCAMEGEFFRTINPFKALIKGGKEIRASKLIDPIPIDIGNLVPRNIFSASKDTEFGVFFSDKTIGKL